MQLKNLVFHKLETVQHVKIVKSTPRKEIVALPDERAASLVEGIRNGYKNEGAQAYATFASTGWFKEKLYDLATGRLDFYTFSTHALDYLTEILTKTPSATGGYLTFAEFEYQGDDFFMVVLIKDKEGIGITDKLELEDVHTLNLEKLHFAARINITEWLLSINDRKNHVSFLKGKGRSDEVVEYFKLFIGIAGDSYQDPARQTKELVIAIKNFCSEKYDGDVAGMKRKSIQEYTQDRASRSLPIILTEIANLISPDAPSDFIAYVDSKKLDIPGEFKATRRELKRLTKYQFKGVNSEYTISFEQSAIEGNHIWLNGNGNLEISDIPDHIRSQLVEK
jgi:nucleoid-associated protein